MAEERFSHVFFQPIADDNVFSRFLGVRGLDQRQKYSKGARGIQISKKKGIRSKISVVYYTTLVHVVYYTTQVVYQVYYTTHVLN